MTYFSKSIMLAMMMMSLDPNFKMPKGEVYHPPTTFPSPSIDKHGEDFVTVMNSIEAEIIGVFEPNSGSHYIVRRSPIIRTPFMTYNGKDSISIYYVNKSMMRKVRPVTDEERVLYVDKDSPDKEGL